MRTKPANRKSRQGLYRVGTCKVTFTTDNEDKVRVHRRSVRLGYKDDSAYLRALVHEAVWNEPLFPEDYDTLRKMIEKQENI